VGIYNNGVSSNSRGRSRSPKIKSCPEIRELVNGPDYHSRGAFVELGNPSRRAGNNDYFMLRKQSETNCTNTFSRNAARRYGAVNRVHGPVRCANPPAYRG